MVLVDTFWVFFSSDLSCSPFIYISSLSLSLSLSVYIYMYIYIYLRDCPFPDDVGCEYVLPVPSLFSSLLSFWNLVCPPLLPVASHWLLLWQNVSFENAPPLGMLMMMIVMMSPTLLRDATALPRKYRSPPPHSGRRSSCALPTPLAYASAACTALFPARV